VTRRAPVALLVLLTAGCLLPARPAALLAEEPCPSSEACLSKSLDRNWQQYYDLIEQAWADKQKAAALILRAQAAGRQDIVDAIKEKQVKIEERWAFADAVAHTLTSPFFKDYLERQREEAVRVRSAASENARKETDLYHRLEKSTIGPERDGVIRDISGYEKEGKELRETFYRDGFMVSLSTLKESSELLSSNWANMSKWLASYNLDESGAFKGAEPYVFAMNAVVFSAHSSAEAVHAGMGVQEASQKDHNFEALLEATRGVAGGTLHMAELLARSPTDPLKREAMEKAFGASAARAGIYTNVLAVGLDTVLTVAATDRLKQSEARQLHIETDDAHWRARVDTSGRIAHDAAMREDRANRQIEHQQQVEALYKKIQEGTK
jgi:hypothetical protein